MALDQSFLPGFAVAALFALRSASLIDATSLLGEPHVIGGTNTDIEKVPYQLSLEIYRFHSCGAAIISDRHALTAAHCAHPGESGPQWAMRLRAGSTIQFPYVNFGGKVHYIETITRHPNYAIHTNDYDVAVLSVTKKFAFGSRVQPIPIPTKSEDAFINYERPVTISGWGLTKIDGWIPPLHLQSTEVPLIRRNKCKFLMPPEFYGYLSPRMLCGAGTGKVDTNTGDSGGPVAHKGKLIGLASWGLRTIDPTLPCVFTNLLDVEIRDFIQTETGV